MKEISQVERDVRAIQILLGFVIVFFSYQLYGLVIGEIEKEQIRTGNVGIAENILNPSFKDEITVTDVNDRFYTATQKNAFNIQEVYFCLKSGEWDSVDKTIFQYIGFQQDYFNSVTSHDRFRDDSCLKATSNKKDGRVQDEALDFADKAWGLFNQKEVTIQHARYTKDSDEVLMGTLIQKVKVFFSEERDLATLCFEKKPNGMTLSKLSAALTYNADFKISDVKRAQYNQEGLHCAVFLFPEEYPVSAGYQNLAEAINSKIDGHIPALRGIWGE